MSDPTQRPAQDFWPFSLEVYRKPGVEGACLSLQDEAGLDVNAVLFCCWAGASGYGCLTDLEMEAVFGVTQSWNVSVVKPLRSVRRVLKDHIGPAPEGPVAALRQAVKDIELEAEWHEQRLLGDLLQRDPDQGTSRQAIRINFESYFKKAQVALTPERDKHLTFLEDAALDI